MGVREDVKKVWERAKAKPGCAVMVIVMLLLFVWLCSLVETEFTTDMVPVPEFNPYMDSVK